jgi:hypothetical protein
MAYLASTAGRNAKRQGGGEIVAFPMKASMTIYKGDIVMIDITDGFAQSMLIDTSCAQYDQFAGVAAETKVSPASGTVYINVYVTGSFEFTCHNATDTLAATDMGVVAYADTQAAGSGTPYKVCKTGASAKDITVGRFIGLPELGAATTARKVRVRIDGYAGCLSVCANT